MLVTSHHAPPAALKGVSRLDFQKALDRVLYGPADAAPSRDDVRMVAAFACALNAVLAQGAALFFAEGAKIETPQQARFALALYNADPGQFSFDGCNCDAASECSHRQDWLDFVRRKARAAA
ncbi:MAG: hypothetical protein JO256_09190 [Alphaproteobacteria bacterium]|nr:hypothetical protein [Alphaproteobacteria bacterium]